MSVRSISFFMVGVLLSISVYLAFFGWLFLIMGAWSAWQEVDTKAARFGLLLSAVLGLVWLDFLFYIF